MRTTARIALTLAIAMGNLVLAPSAQAARPKCFGKRATIVGTAKSQTINGTRRADVIHAGGGNDKVYGKGGKDLICGGGGNDTLLGAGGNDKISGGSGKDKLDGGAGKDLLVGGKGIDSCKKGETLKSCEPPKPIANNDSYEVAANSTLAQPAPGIFGNDTKNGGSLSAPTTSVNGGTVSVTADGSFVFEPMADYIGPDSFTYTLTNAAGNDDATVTIVVKDAPDAVDDGYATAEDTPLIVDAAQGVLSNDVPNGATITDPPFAPVITSQGGSVHLDADEQGGFTYVPDSGFNGVDSFQYTLTKGSESDTATVTIAVSDPPMANADDYAATGNIGISVDAALGLFANDQLFGATLIGFDPVSTNGGDVQVQADGAFTYNPPAGYEGSDTFTYTVENAVGTSTGTVTITVDDVVWFVNTAAAPGGDGRFGTPLDSLAPLQGISDPDEAGDFIFLYAGSGPYAGGMTLENDQQLIGNGVDLVVNAITVVTAAGTPAITNASGNGITLASGNTIRGLTVGDTSGTDISGSAVGALTVSDVAITGSGRAFDVSSSGALDVSLSSVTSTSSSGAPAIRLVGTSGTFTAPAGAISGAAAGSIQISGGNSSFGYGGTITNTAGRPLDVSNHTGGTITLTGAMSASGGQGVSLTNNTGTGISLTGALTLSPAAGNVAFQATGGGTVEVTNPANVISGSGAAGLTISNTSIGAGDMRFQSISATGSTRGIDVTNTGSGGSLIVTGSGTENSGGQISTMSADGIRLSNTIDPSLSHMHISNSSGHALSMSDVGGTVTIANTLMVTSGDDLVSSTNNNLDQTLNVTAGQYVGSADDAFSLAPNGSSDFTASISGATFTNVAGSSLFFNPTVGGSNGSSQVVFSGNSITSTIANQGGGVVISGQGSTEAELTITGNNFNGVGGPGLVATDANDSSAILGSIADNTIQNAPGMGISATLDDSSESRLVIQDNILSNLGSDGISVANFDGTGTSSMSVQIRDNQVSTHNTSTTGAAFVAGISVFNFAESACLALTGNSVSGTQAGFSSYHLQRDAGTFTYEGPTVAAVTAADVSAANAADGTPVVSGTINFSNDVPCEGP